MAHLTWPAWLPRPLVNILVHSTKSYQNKLKQFLDRFSYDYAFSVTELNKSPKQIWLARNFSDVMTIDILEDNWHSMLGSLMHKMLEEHAPDDCIVEDRQGVMLNIDGLKVLFHGEPDLYDPKLQKLTDYKYVSANSMIYDKTGYIDQLNRNAFLLQTRGIKVREIENCYLFRYLDNNKRRIDPDYPQTNAQVILYPLQKMADIQNGIIDRISHILKFRDTPWKKQPDCSAEERWEHGTWGVYTKLKDKKRLGEWSTKAKGRFETERDAKSFAIEVGEETRVEYKAGEPNLCRFCRVQQWCVQRQEELKAKEKQLMSDDD